MAVHMDGTKITMDGYDTLAKLFCNRVAQWGDKIAMREKNFGVWEAYSWADYDAYARKIATSLFFPCSTRVAISSGCFSR